MAPIWRITLLGGLQAQHLNASHTHFGTRKTAALLAYLALFPATAHPREVIAEALWPDEDPEATRDRFRQALSTLRRLLEPEEAMAGRVLMADRAGVQFVSGAVTTDVAEFEAGVKAATAEASLAKRATRLAEALDLYRGELLPGYYEAWIPGERERLAELHRNTLGLLADAKEQQGDLPAALEIARRVVAGDPLREDAHAHVMRLYAAQGRLSDAVRQYQELERLLKTRLDSAPSAMTQTLYAQLRAGMPATIEPATAANLPINAAPTPLTLIPLEPEGGAVPLESPFYLIRPTDGEFAAAIGRRDSIVLVKGARQMGKTSLLARGLHLARRSGAQVALTDLQKLTATQMESADALFFVSGKQLPPSASSQKVVRSGADGAGGSGGTGGLGGDMAARLHRIGPGQQQLYSLRIFGVDVG